MEACFRAPGWRDFVSAQSTPRAEQRGRWRTRIPAWVAGCLSMSLEGRFEHKFVTTLLQSRAPVPFPGMPWRVFPSPVWCGLPLDSRGHHHAASSVAGVLGRKGFAVEVRHRFVVRQGQSVNERPRAGHVGQPCLETLADGLPLHHSWLWTPHSCQS